MDARSPARLTIALILVLTAILGHAAPARADYEDELEALSLSMADLPPGFVEVGDYQFHDDPVSGATLARLFERNLGPKGPAEANMQLFNLVARFPDAFTAEQALRNPHAMLNMSRTWDEVAAPALGDASRAFRRTLGGFGGAYVIARQANLVFSVSLQSAGQPVPLDAVLPYAATVQARATRALATAAANAAARPSATASGIAGPADPRLAAAVPTVADVPGYLRAIPEGSGPMNMGPAEGNMAIWVHEQMSDAEHISDLATFPAGTMASIASLGLLLPELPGAPSVPVESALRSGLAGGLVGGRGSARILSEYAGILALGDEAEVGAMELREADVTATVAVVVFRRGELLEMLALTAIGDKPPMEEAIQLARLVDGRLAAAGPAAAIRAAARAELAATGPEIAAAAAPRLAAALVTEEDLPENMWPVFGRGSVFSMFGTAGYMMMFGSAGTSDAGTRLERLARPDDRIQMLIEFAAVVPRTVRAERRGSFLDSAGDMLTALIPEGATGVSIGPTTALPALPVGEYGEGVSVQMTTAGTQLTVTYLMFERDDVVVVMGAVVDGDGAMVEPLLQLAQTLDARLMGSGDLSSAAAEAALSTR